MSYETEFAGRVADAFEHLYDLVYLGKHPLIQMLALSPSLPPGTGRRENAWKLHQILLDAINELSPGPQAPTFSREWRRYRLMALRYVDGLTPQAIADQLAVSRRQYYRMHEVAIEALSNVLWNRYGAQVAQIEARATPSASATDSDRHENVAQLELLRLEAAQIAQADRYTRVEEVIDGVLLLLAEKLKQRGLDVYRNVSENLPDVAVDRSLLRQVLLGVLGYLIERISSASLRLDVQVEGADIQLTVTVEGPSPISLSPPSEVQQRMADLEELASLSEVQLLPLTSDLSIVGFDIRVPTRPGHTVLVVDDNDDVLELFQRYLGLHHYHVVTAKTAHDALILARRLQPFVITLDLMMPDQDGWDLLQAFLNQAETQHIPILVCSVLPQKELALSLGATAFLKKPVSEEVLLSTLRALDKTA